MGARLFCGIRIGRSSSVGLLSLSWGDTRGLNEIDYLLIFDFDRVDQYSAIDGGNASKHRGNATMFVVSEFDCSRGAILILKSQAGDVVGHNEGRKTRFGLNFVGVDRALDLDFEGDGIESHLLHNREYGATCTVAHSNEHQLLGVIVCEAATTGWQEATVGGHFEFYGFHRQKSVKKMIVCTK